MNVFRRIYDVLFGESPASAPGGSSLTVDGDAVSFDLADGRRVSMAGRKMVYDASGTRLPANALFFGPGDRTGRPIPMNRWQSSYFGDDYDARATRLRDFEDARARTGWRSVGEVRMIWYTRRGSLAGRWYHPFRPPAGTVLLLEKRGAWYRVVGPPGSGTLVNWRGIVRP